MRVILVPVADRPECAKALQTAFDLGKRLGASVSGCHIRPHRESATSMSNAAWKKKSSKKAPEAARKLYEDMAERNGYEIIKRARVAPGALWSERVGAPGKLMGIIGPVSDMVVVSRPEKAGGVAEMFLNSALIESGRPVLVLPPAGRRNLGKKVCIAWNQSCEAANATMAALPILKKAEQVTIVSCGAEDRVGPKSTQIASYLAHWGIKTKRISTRGKDIEKELISTFKETGSDLMLAGAYSRSRWREKVFGGTSEYLLRKAKIPVLMLHH
ncbi:MAG: universal stress protein [Woeseiaceae bacterium]|nr:universal stress protein [Woeseiaceae bacterium]